MSERIGPAEPRGPRGRGKLTIPVAVLAVAAVSLLAAAGLLLGSSRSGGTASGPGPTASQAAATGHAAPAASLPAPGSAPVSGAPAAGSSTTPTNRSWPPVILPADVPDGPDTGDLASLAAVSRDEVFAQDGGGVWRWHDGRWTRIGEPAGASIPDRGLLRIAPDGALWAAGASGARRFADGRWQAVTTDPVSSIAFDANGAAYVSVNSPSTMRPAVLVYVRSGDEWSMWTFPTPLGTVASVLVDREATIWVTSDNGWTGDQRGCVVRHPLVPSPLSQPWWSMPAPVFTSDGDVAPCAANALTLAPDGDVLLTYDPVTDAWGAERRVARWDAGTRTWTVWGKAEGLPHVSDGPSPIAVATDGTAWVGTNGGLYRDDGAGWTAARPGGTWGPVSAAPDGSVWAVGPAGLERVAP